MLFNKTTVFLNTQKHYPVGRKKQEKALFLYRKFRIPFCEHGAYTFRKKFFENVFCGLGWAFLPLRAIFILKNGFLGCLRSEEKVTYLRKITGITQKSGKPSKDTLCWGSTIFRVTYRNFISNLLKYHQEQHLMLISDFSP